MAALVAPTSLCLQFERNNSNYASCWLASQRRRRHLAAHLANRFPYHHLDSPRISRFWTTLEHSRSRQRALSPRHRIIKMAEEDVDWGMDEDFDPWQGAEEQSGVSVAEQHSSVDAKERNGMETPSLRSNRSLIPLLDR